MAGLWRIRAAYYLSEPLKAYWKSLRGVSESSGAVPRMLISRRLAYVAGASAVLTFGRALTPWVKRGGDGGRWSDT